MSATLPGVLEHLLAAPDLAGEAGVDALDEPGLVLQVGDHPGDVRQFGERGEGGAALVVDQDQGQVLRRSAWRPGRAPGCAAARSCRSRSRRRTARAVPCRAGRTPSGRAAPARAASSSPIGTRRKSRSPRGAHSRARSRRGGVGDAEQRGEVDRAGHAGALGGGLRVTAAAAPAAGRCPRRRATVTGVDGALRRRPACSPRRSSTTHPVAVDGDPDADLVRFVDLLGEQVHAP